jgi:hypothetical protein
MKSLTQRVEARLVSDHPLDCLEGDITSLAPEPSEAVDDIMRSLPLVSGPILCRNGIWRGPKSLIARLPSSR